MRVYLSLGSNRGDRRAHLEACVAALPAAGVRVRRVSAWMESRPLGMTSRARFLNGVVEGDTDLPPRVLMRRLLRLERQLGRHRLPQPRKTPRSIDVDVIFYGHHRIAASDLEVPHPRWRQRRFVLAGLRELGLRRPPRAC